MTVLGMGTFGDLTVIVADCVVGQVGNNGQTIYDRRIDKIDFYSQRGVAVTICGDEVVTHAFEFLVRWAESTQMPWDCLSTSFRDALVECANRLRGAYIGNGHSLSLSPTNVYMCSSSGVRGWRLTVQGGQLYACLDPMPTFLSPGDLILDCGGNIFCRNAFAINSPASIENEIFQEMSKTWNALNSIPYPMPTQYSAIVFDRSNGKMHRTSCHQSLTDLVASLTNMPIASNLRWSPSNLI